MKLEHGYVKKDGSFSHTKLGNSPEEANCLIDTFIGWASERYKNKDDLNILILELNNCRETGIVPQNILLSVVMPPCREKFKQTFVDIGEVLFEVKQNET
jgi:pantothenate kinase type III